MGLDVYAYGCLGYKLPDDDLLYFQKEIKFKPCCENNFGKMKFCSECGTNISDRKYQKYPKSEYNEYDKFDGFKIVSYYTESNDEKVLCLEYAETNMNRGPHLKRIDISKINETREKIKDLFVKHNYPYDENNFGSWLIMNPSY